jgi:hypothetical protein
MDADDNFTKVGDSEAPAPSPKKLNRLEREELTYNKAYGKLVCVMVVSTFFVCV